MPPAPATTRSSPGARLTAGVLALLLCACGGAGRRPPIVLILLDALHAGHVTHLGYRRDTTPNLDALAAEGVTFARAYAPAPYTLASIPSMLTGRLPDHHGLTRPGLVLPQAERTLAEILGDAGYRTFAAVANLQGGSSKGVDQGFDVFEELFRPGFERTADGEQRIDKSELHVADASEFPPVVECWLGAVEPDERCFFYTHILEPHLPYAPPEPFLRRYLDPGYDGVYKDGRDSDLVLERADEEKELERADKIAARALYDGNLRYADSVVGELLDLLRAHDVYRRALIVVTSDHGEAFWQHERWGHGWQLYDETLRVPLILKFPEGTGPVGLRVERMVSPMDLVPTLCEWLDLAPPPALDGRSLMPLIADPGRASERHLYLRSAHIPPWLGVRTDEEKLIVSRRERSGDRRVEYYRLDEDERERHDRYRGEREHADALATELEAWLAGTLQQREESCAPPTEAERQLLNDLGYFEYAEHGTAGGEDADAADDSREAPADPSDATRTR